MNEKTKSTATETEGSIDITALSSAATLGGAVVVGAIYEPKLPPYSGD